MRARVALVFNEPISGRYEAIGEKKAVLGVLEAVDAVYQALSELGYDVVRVPLLPPLDNVKRKLSALGVDLVFNLFEGFDGHPEAEAEVADILSDLKVTYTGCRGTTLSLALDKVRAKSLLLEAGILTPRYQVLDREQIPLFHLDYPCIVKPCTEDASHGISEQSVISDFTALEKQVAWVIGTFGGKALVEEYIEGRELNVTVIGKKKIEVLPLTEIVYSLPSGFPKILAYSAKWDQDSVYYQCTKPVCPAEVEPGLKNQIVDVAVRVFSLFDCVGYARIDFRVDGEGKPCVIEINPNPDISPGAGLALQARAAGMDYMHLVEKLVLLALGEG
jgi:D-alanine-D-alanine ligase